MKTLANITNPIQRGTSGLCQGLGIDPMPTGIKVESLSSHEQSAQIGWSYSHTALKSDNEFNRKEVTRDV